ncbi:hypothetical protein CAEBREN_09683 [Caenorhabditis brenneri]|uniref:Uncharacterized protein n=1 Tax=Caenorhabditis brenneri TaxID=135651 RepID=G0MMR8_CAEBE|nr:hypothetical protein CAEBREN_09683 [Caenorhabditis brenneri]
MDLFNSNGTQNANNGAQQALDAMEAEQAVPHFVTDNKIATDVNNEAITGNAGIGNLQFSVNNILANSLQAVPPGTQVMQNGLLPGTAPNIMSLIIQANIQAMLSRCGGTPVLSTSSLLPAPQRMTEAPVGWPAPDGLSLTGSSSDNSSSSSLTNSSNPSPLTVPWNNTDVNLLMDTYRSSRGIPGILSTTSSSLASSESSSLSNSVNPSPSVLDCLPNAPSVNDSTQNGGFPWNSNQLPLMNLSSWLYKSQAISGQGLGTQLTPATSSRQDKTLQGPTRAPRPRKKQCPVRNAVDRYRRAWRREIKKRSHVAPIIIGSEKYEKKLNQAKDHYITSAVNNNEFLKEIPHFLNPHLINPFNDFPENFPRRKTLQTPTPRKLYAEYMSRVTGNNEYNKFNELEEEKSEEYYKWCKLAEMVQQEVLKQIKKGFITRAV